MLRVVLPLLSRLLKIVLLLGYKCDGCLRVVLLLSSSQNRRCGGFERYKVVTELFLLLLGLVVVVGQVAKGRTAAAEQAAENCTVAGV